MAKNSATPQLSNKIHVLDRTLRQEIFLYLILELAGNCKCEPSFRELREHAANIGGASSVQEIYVSAAV